MEKFHTRLKRLREAQGLTVKRLAAIIGVPESTYRDWEYGGAVQGQPYVKLSSALNIGLYELMTGSKVDQEPISRSIAELEKNLNELKRALLPIFGSGPRG